MLLPWTQHEITFPSKNTVVRGVPIKEIYTQVLQPYKYKCMFYCLTVFKHFCLISQIMKEWAEADNQSKNLPKSERQALNEVCRLFLALFLSNLLC